MTLSGRAAELHPEIDALKPVPLGIVTHAVRETDKRGTKARMSAGPMTSIGLCDPETGMYETTAGQMTEAGRRAAGLRRNGRPRRRTDR